MVYNQLLSSIDMICTDDPERKDKIKKMQNEFAKDHMSVLKDMKPELVKAFQEKMKNETAKSQAGFTVSTLGPYQALKDEIEGKERQINRLIKDHDRLVKKKDAMTGYLNDTATDIVYGAYLKSQEKSLQGEKRKLEVDIGISTRGESDDSLLDGTAGSSVAGGASASTTTSWYPFGSRK